MKTGEVKFYNRTKEFGFVRDTADGKEYFFHKSVIEGDYVPDEGHAVEFDGEMGEKGPRATVLRKAGAAPAEEADEDDSEDADDADEAEDADEDDSEDEDLKE